MATAVITNEKCANCGGVENTKRCSGCKSVWYCSTKCQTIDWKANHKKQCKKLKNKSRQNDKKMDNKKETDTKMKMWKCNICGFGNSITTKKCMVCTQLGIKITVKNSRPHNMYNH